MPRREAPGIVPGHPDEKVILYLDESDVRSLAVGHLPIWMIDSAKRTLGWFNGTAPLLKKAEGA